MKRLSAFCASLGLFLMANPMTALAAEQEGGASASSVPLWTASLYCDSAACEGRMVGRAPASCGCSLVNSFYHSVCDALQCGDSTGNGSGMPGQ